MVFRFVVEQPTRKQASKSPSASVYSVGKPTYLVGYLQSLKSDTTNMIQIVTNRLLAHVVDCVNEL